MQADEKIQKLLHRIPKSGKAAFLAAVIAGYIIHLYVFTNTIPNADGISRVYELQQMSIVGRWFLTYASALHGYIQAPALIGALSLLFIGLAAIFAVDLLQLESALSGAFAGILMIAGVAVTYTYAFLFTASAYFLAVFLVVLAVWLTVRRRHGWIFGAVLLACGLGTYQAYLAVALSAAVSFLVIRLFDETFSVADAWKTFGKFVLLFGCGVGVYFVMMRVFLRVKHLSLISYRGMNDNLSVHYFAGRIRLAYRDFADFLFQDGYVTFSSKLWVLLNALFVVLFAVQILLMIVRSRIWRQPGKVCWLMAALVILPLTLNFSEVISDATPLMRFSAVYLYLMVFALAEQYERIADFSHAVRRTGRMEMVCCVLAAVFILREAQIDNTVYTGMQTAHRATESFLTTLVTRVEELDGYEEGMEVLIIGKPSGEVYHSGVKALQDLSTTAGPSDTVLMETKHVYYYLNNWLNVDWEEPEEETLINMSDSSAFREMPLYPDDGSVAILDGKVVVRLSESYTPKEQFEIDYENRH